MTISVTHIHYVLPCYDTDSGDFADSYGFGIAEGNPAIIGNIALNGYVAVFDVENHRCAERPLVVRFGGALL